MKINERIQGSLCIFTAIFGVSLGVASSVL
jgi:hypothetical protein